MKLALSIVLLIFAVGGQAFILNGCKNENEQCDFNDHCCGKLHCYYPNGFDPTDDGECVECIDRSLVCQKDSQCCGDNLLCQKETPVSVNGICDVLKPASARCYKDSQCASKNCDKDHFWNLYGECA